MSETESFIVIRDQASHLTHIIIHRQGQREQQQQQQQSIPTSDNHSILLHDVLIRGL